MSVLCCDLGRMDQVLRLFSRMGSHNILHWRNEKSFPDSINQYLCPFSRDKLEQLRNRACVRVRYLEPRLRGLLKNNATIKVFRM